MKVIVTGANGFLGAQLCQLLEENGHHIIAIVRNSDSDICAIKHLSNTRIVYCDLQASADLPKIISDKDIDCCVHFAWEGAQGDARGDEVIQLRNVFYTCALCVALEKMKVKRFVGIGTIAETEFNHFISMDGSKPDRKNCYGAAKTAAYHFSKIVCSQKAIEHVWCRLSNTYGIGDRTNNIINMALKKMINKERLSFTEGKQLYDFIYVSDVISAIYGVMENGKPNHAYLLGSGKPMPLKKYIEIMKSLISPKQDLHLGEVPYNGISLTENDYSIKELQEDTAFSPQISFEEGIIKTSEWLAEEGAV